MTMINPEAFISEATKIANISDYLGHYTELGGGELNDTYLIHCRSRDIVLRISRNPERQALAREERALKLLQDLSGVPRLIFFDANKRIDNHLWIIEEYLPGEHDEQLSIDQFQSLGHLLAEIHSIEGTYTCPDPWQTLLSNSSSFGDEDYLLFHPDQQLRLFINKVKSKSSSLAIQDRKSVLRHCDITPSNTLIYGDDLALIDWELSNFGDPMSDFSTGYWSDMALNNGKWRHQISTDEQKALYRGYTEGGGKLNEELAQFYELIDKVGVAIYLYWRLNVSDWQARDGMPEQYRTDYENILVSLGKSLPS